MDLAVDDIHWAKEHGLGGVMMPALLPGGTFFFDPALDPVWAACVDVGLPVSQHGGTGAPTYGPPGFAAIMTLALEHSFYSGRSLWQMILGGVFERFPALRLAFIETEADWIAPVIRKLDRRLDWGDDWTGWAQTLQRMRQFTGSARDYWAANCMAGISPFTEDQVPLDELARPSADYDAFAIGCDNAMFGVDYPHFESVFPETKVRVDALVQHPSISAEVSRKILYENAAGLYGFDLARLASDVERVGFEIDGSAAPDRAESVEAVAPGHLAQPACRRLDRPREVLAVDGDEAERLGEAGVPFEVVEQRPVEVAAHVDPVRHALGQALESGAGVGDPRLVVVGRHAVLGHEHRHPGVLGGQPDGVAERIGVDLPARLHGGRPVGRRELAVRPDACPGVGLHADEVVVGGDGEPIGLGHPPRLAPPLLAVLGRLEVDERQGPARLDGRARRL